MKLLTSIMFACMLLLTLNSKVLSQDSSDGIEDISDSDPDVKVVNLATGGSVKCKCGGKVPFKRINADSTFSNVVVDSETDEIQFSFEVEGETNKSIIELDVIAKVNPCLSFSKFIDNKRTNSELSSFMIDLSRTSKETGEEINVTNEIRQILESQEIDVEVDNPVKGFFKLNSFAENLASGLVKVVFKNTGKIIEKASELTEENIEIDENGRVSIVCKFTDVPINGSFRDLSCVNSDTLPNGVSLDDLPEGIDPNNLPSGLSISDLPPGFDLNDLDNIPPGFDVSDVLELPSNLPSGFGVSDLGNVPPGFDLNDLSLLPNDFNLGDLSKIPPDVDIKDLPPGVTINDVISGNFDPNDQNPSGIDPSNLPPGITQEDLDKLPPGIDLNSIPSDLLPGLIDGTALPCVNDAIIPGFENTVPPGFDCSNPTGGTN